MIKSITLKIELPNRFAEIRLIRKLDQMKLKYQVIEPKPVAVSKIYNFCPLCENLGVILDEGCCIDCWETKILPGK